MKCASTVLLLFGIFLLSAQEVASEVSIEPRNPFKSPRIVGGENVTDRSQYAYQVSIRYAELVVHCGGTIVSKKHVLTAAHCCYLQDFLYPVYTLTAVVGDLYLTASSDTVTRNISSYIIHENYHPNDTIDDVALMRLAEPFPEWTSTINLIPLATSSPESGTNCVVSGWGTTQELERVSEVLRAVTVPIVDRDTCATAYYLDVIQDGMICAGVMEGGKGVCYGDEGGPLVCNSVLVGILSWSFGCAREGFPGVYTDVAYYHSWIEAKISADGNDEQDNGAAEVSPLKFRLLIVGLLWHIYVILR